MKVASLALVSLVVPALAVAQPPPPPPAPGYGPTYGAADPTAHRHDGFYLRLFLGLGYTSMSVDEADVDVSGAGGAFGLALGYAVSDNFIIYGEVFDDIAVNPEVNGGQNLGDDVAAGVVALGIGAAYYFQPHNIYLSGTLAMGQVTIQVDGEEVAESDFGPGLSLMVGKEWWVSPNWGVGIAAQLFAGKMKDKNDGPDISTTAAAIAFSATFN
jgi:hypothetical protein